MFFCKQKLQIVIFFVISSVHWGVFVTINLCYLFNVYYINLVY